MNPMLQDIPFKVKRVPLQAAEIVIQEAITWLAYGVVMSPDALQDFLHSNGEVGGDDDAIDRPTPMIDRYWRAMDLILDAARMDRLKLYGRPPLSLPAGESYPENFGDYHRIPPETFIDTSLYFGPEPEPMISAASSPYWARWFKVVADASGVSSLAATMDDENASAEPRGSREKQATVRLAAALKADPSTTKSKARSLLVAAGLPSSGRPFDQRIWTGARLIAGLDKS